MPLFARLLLGLSTLPVLLCATPAQAGSFSVNENSANDLGRANAGRVTSVEDAIAAFGNPAMLVHHDRALLTATLSYIDGSASFEDRGSVDILGNSLGRSTDGFFGDAFVPAFTGVLPLNDRIALGLAVNVPFGLSSSYDPDALVRYQGIDSELTTININPSVGFALSDSFSIGGGVSLQYAEAELSSAIDFGAVCFGQVGPATCGALGLTPQSADGLLEVVGDDWSFGWNIGAAFTPTDRLTLGASYRSEVDHTLEGEAEFTVPVIAAPLAAGGAFTDTGGTAELDLPAMLEVGLRWRASERLDLYGSYTRMYWEDLEALTISFENPLQPQSSEELDYEAADRFSFGADYHVSNDWTVRGGLAFDESPSQEDLSTVRIPDNDRVFYAVGATYRGFNFARVDIAYNRVDVDDTDFRRVGPSGDTVVGLVEGSANIFSISLSRQF